MGEFSAVVLATFILYLLAMVAIGVVAYRKTENLADYILGGRRLGRWVAALSAGASDMSGWLLLGLPGYAYAAGLESIWLAVGLLLGTWLNWRVVAERLRRYSEEAGDALTIPGYFENRFQSHRTALRVVSASIILFFFLFYTSSGLVAGGKLFETVFSVPYHWAVVLSTSVIILYTLTGGFLAVAWTDLVQGLLMLAAILLVPVVALVELGGAASTLDTIAQHNGELLNPFTDSDGSRLTIIATASLLGWGLGYFGQPHILARFKAIRHSSDISGARHIAVTWSTLTLLGAILVGLVGIATPVTIDDGEKIFMVLVSALFHPLIAGVLLAAILAAIMSTADSQLLVCSAALTEDFYKLLRRQASDRELVAVGRLAVVLIAVLALVIALNRDTQVLDLVSYAWGGFGAAFGPVIILSLYWRRMTGSGAMAGILVGGTTVVLWKQLNGGLFDLYELIPGFVLATIAAVVVTLLSAPPSQAVAERHDSIVK